MAPPAAPDPAKAARALAAEVSYARRLIDRVGGRLLLTFVTIAACLWGFGELADEVLDGEPFPFDQPLLEFARQLATPLADDVFIGISAVGYAWGVIPGDIALVLWLAIRRRFRNATFALFATVGSALINVAAKQTFRRDRPSLWESTAPELTYSFPSAHAMGSATLATVVVFLAWGTRFRWAAVSIAGLFVVAVGLSRVYLGVHYPSDILAGWVAAIAWCAAAHALVYRRKATVAAAPEI